MYSIYPALCKSTSDRAISLKLPSISAPVVHRFPHSYSACTHDSCKFIFHSMNWVNGAEVHSVCMICCSRTSRSFKSTCLCCKVFFPKFVVGKVSESWAKKLPEIFIHLSLCKNPALWGAHVRWCDEAFPSDMHKMVSDARLSAIIGGERFL